MRSFYLLSHTSGVKKKSRSAWLHLGYCISSCVPWLKVENTYTPADSFGSLLCMLLYLGASSLGWSLSSIALVRVRADQPGCLRSRSSSGSSDQPLEGPSLNLRQHPEANSSRRLGNRCDAHGVSVLCRAHRFEPHRLLSYGLDTNEFMSRHMKNNYTR